MNAHAAIDQFERMQEFRLLADRARLATRMLRFEDAINHVSELEALASKLHAHYYRKTAERAKKNLILRLLDQYDSPSSIQQAKPADVAFWKHAANEGSIKACRLIITAAQAQFFPELVAEKEQVEWLARSVKYGDPDSYCELAEILDEGRPYQEREHEKATELYRCGYQILLSQAAKGISSRSAYVKLGNLIRRGIPGGADDNEKPSFFKECDKSIFWYRRALEADFGIGSDVATASTRRPLDAVSADAMINLAEVLELTGRERNGNPLSKRYWWAARSRAPFALRALAEFLRRAYKDDFPLRRLMRIYRMSADGGDEVSQLKLALLERSQRSSSAHLHTGLLQYDLALQGSLEKLLTNGEGIFIRGMYRLIVSNEPAIHLAERDFKIAFSLNYSPGEYWRRNLGSSSFLYAMLECRELAKPLFSPGNNTQTLRGLAVEVQRFFGMHSHYDVRFLRYRERLYAAGLLMENRFIAWLQLVSKLADLLCDADKRFWNQLAIDAQLNSTCFARLYGVAAVRPRFGDASKFDRAIAKSTAQIGICPNARDELGLPVRSQWRPRLRSDRAGWQTIPDLSISAEGYIASSAPESSGTPPLLIEEDIEVVLILALLEGGTAGASFSLSLESFEDSETVAFPWKFHRKVFTPPWLAATDFGRTLYYCDYIHLQDTDGRSTFSTANPRVSAEYSHTWHLEFPWCKSQIRGSSAWNADYTRSAITLEALQDPKPPEVSGGKILISGKAQPLMHFDRTCMVWENGVEKRRVGDGNRRYQCVRGGEYADHHYDTYAEQFPAFERIKLLLGLYSLVCWSVKEMPFDPRSTLGIQLADKRNAFDSCASRIREDNPNLVVFDLR